MNKTSSGWNLDRSISRSALLAAILLACSAFAAVSTAAAGYQSDRLAETRNRMVDEEVVGAGIKNERVIEAMRLTPRHEFIPTNRRRFAYYDMALPIGSSQTISPPFIVALMTEYIDPQPTDRVLEIGTGSGYQSAVLSPLVKDVYTIEIVEDLGRRAARTLSDLGYENVHTRIGDGYLGWPEKAPFDKIIVTCSPENVPRALIEQLREGGSMIIPMGERFSQNLCLLKKVDGELEVEELRPTLFVPMTGRAEEKRKLQPDGSKPALHNGSFEESFGEPLQLVGWHYQRQMEIVEDDDAQDGESYVTFKNEMRGRGAQALQGFAVDGREVKRMTLSAWVRGEGIVPGNRREEMAAIIVVFYDELRHEVGTVGLGPWRGTFPWDFFTATVPVPPKARDAIIRVGLLGATGEMSVDGLKVEATPQPSSPFRAGRNSAEFR